MLAIIFFPNLKILALPPNWTVNPAQFQFSMSLLGRLQTNSVFDNSAQNMVGVFVGNELRGVATPILVGGAAYFFTTVYSNSYIGEVLNFKIFVQSDDKIYASTDVLSFRHNDFSGKFDAPFLVKICREYALASSTINPTCNGSANGTIFTTVNGFASAYTYLWSNGKTTKNINLLPAGSFTVTVTDPGGCISTKTTVLAQPPTINFAVNFMANAPGFDANFTVSGGTPTFVFNRTYMVATDFRVATDPIFDHLAANTTFVFKARDANGCLKSVIKKTPATAVPSNGASDRNGIFLKNILSENQFVLFPNPTDNELKINFLNEEPVVGQVEVFNQLGQKVLVEIIKNRTGRGRRFAGRTFAGRRVFFVF